MRSETPERWPKGLLRWSRPAGIGSRVAAENQPIKHNTKARQSRRSATSNHCHRREIHARVTRVTVLKRFVFFLPISNGAGSELAVGGEHGPPRIESTALFGPAGDLQQVIAKLRFHGSMHLVQFAAEYDLVELGNHLTRRKGT